MNYEDAVKDYDFACTHCSATTKGRKLRGPRMCTDCGHMLLEVVPLTKEKQPMSKTVIEGSVTLDHPMRDDDETTYIKVEGQKEDTVLTKIMAGYVGKKVRITIEEI